MGGGCWPELARQGRRRLSTGGGGREEADDGEGRRSPREGSGGRRERLERGSVRCVYELSLCVVNWWWW